MSREWFHSPPSFPFPALSSACPLAIMEGIPDESSSSREIVPTAAAHSVQIAGAALKTPPKSRPSDRGPCYQTSYCNRLNGLDRATPATALEKQKHEVTWTQSATQTSSSSMKNIILAYELKQKHRGLTAAPIVWVESCLISPHGSTAHAHVVSYKWCFLFNSTCRLPAYFNRTVHRASGNFQ